MGQRSQMYIKVNQIDKNGNKSTELYARYFQWNYGERMISRAAHTLGWVKEHISNLLYGGYEDHKLPSIMETNFDYVDKVNTIDILKETVEYGMELSTIPTSDNKDAYNESIFGMQDNNNGQFFAEVTYNEQTRSITDCKYAFRELYSNRSIPMDAYEYLIRDLGYELEEELDNAMKEPSWESPKSFETFYYEHFSEIHNTKSEEETLEMCEMQRTNIGKLQEMGTVMSKEDLQAFLSFDYSKQLQEVRKEVLKEKINETAGKMVLSVSKKQYEKKLKELTAYYREEPQIEKNEPEEEWER